MSDAYFARVSRGYAKYSSWTKHEARVAEEIDVLNLFAQAGPTTAVDVGTRSSNWLDRVAQSHIYGGRLVRCHRPFDGNVADGRAPLGPRPTGPR